MTKASLLVATGLTIATAIMLPHQTKLTISTWGVVCLMTVLAWFVTVKKQSR